MSTFNTIDNENTRKSHNKFETLKISRTSSNVFTSRKDTLYTSKQEYHSSILRKADEYSKSNFLDHNNFSLTKSLWNNKNGGSSSKYIIPKHESITGSKATYSANEGVIILKEQTQSNVSQNENIKGNYHLANKKFKNLRSPDQSCDMEHLKKQGSIVSFISHEKAFSGQFADAKDLSSIKDFLRPSSVQQPRQSVNLNPKDPTPPKSRPQTQKKKYFFDKKHSSMVLLLQNKQNKQRLELISKKKEEIKEKIIKSRLSRRTKEKECSELNVFHKSIDNINKDNLNATINLLVNTNYEKVEKMYFPYNSEKDHKKLGEMAKFLKSSVNKIISDPFFDNYENRVNFIIDSRILPNLKANLVTEKDQIDNLTFKSRLEKIEHPNIIHPSALVQVNMMRKAKQNKKDNEVKLRNKKKEEKQRETLNEKLENTISQFKQQLAEQFNQNEIMLNFFRYRLDSFNAVYFQDGRIKDSILIIKDE